MAASRLVTVAAWAAAGLFAALLLETAGMARDERPAAATSAPAPRLDRIAPPPRLTEGAAASTTPKRRPEVQQALATLLDEPSTGLRATLQTAMARRAEGGRLYARVLARRCAELAALAETPPADVNDPQWQHAYQQRQELAVGCGQLLSAEWLALASVPANEAGSVDPLLQRLEQGDADPARLVAVLARPDPLLLDELGPRLLARQGDDYVFDGVRFDSDDTRRLIEAALRLLPCDFGLACDGRDPSVWMACLRGEGCHGSRAEQVWTEEAGRDPARQAEITAWRERLRGAIQSGAVERFSAPAAGDIPKTVSNARQM